MQTPKTNYQLVLDKTLREITESGTRPHLLLHACCAPCSSYVLEYLQQYFHITVYYYNPNISPESEYVHRVDEIQRLIRDMCPEVDFWEGKYEPERFYEMAKGLENEPGAGSRLNACGEHRGHYGKAGYEGEQQVERRRPEAGGQDIGVFLHIGGIRQDCTHAQRQREETLPHCGGNG